ncbi:MAG: GNAT family N-acetyltransferase [Kofleriaceae bacterium]|nr:GNAT family N-acetyltransferase [Kofleriaceae bacterium]
MHLLSKGLRSDLAQLDGEILDRGDYLCVRSPKEPEFYWGNLLVFPRAPVAGDYERWQELFAKEFAGQPAVKHQTFTWDCSDQEGEIAPFVQAGYRYEKSVVLCASTLNAPHHPNGEIAIRSLVGDSDWRDLLQCQLLCREDFPEVGYVDFVRKRLAAYRARVETGEGQWYGAFIGVQMVASLGLFLSDDFGRFQSVMTIPEARKRGICATLVHHVSEAALAKPKTTNLLLVADEDYHAGRIYESLGYCKAEEMRGLCRWPELGE